MKKDRLYDILETMKKNPLQAVLSHFGALSDHSVPLSIASNIGVSRGVQGSKYRAKQNEGVLVERNFSTRWSVTFISLLILQ